MHLHIDNCGALELIKSGQINNRTKHIKTKFRHICDHEEAGDISGVHVATEDQMADIMTKSLGAKKFALFQGMIGVHSWGILDEKGCCKLKQVHFPSDVSKVSCFFLSLIDYLIDTY